MQIRHFVLTPDGGIQEFAAELAAGVASGARKMPEFADSRVRYLQVTVDDENRSELKIQTAGASIEFDSDGLIAQAREPGKEEQISGFEHDAVVQWAIRDIPSAGPVFH
tara:strand:- start:831 stop:1157 length:327 start_codon:yes stop_codon:yes gene_type:complete